MRAARSLFRILPTLALAFYGLSCSKPAPDRLPNLILISIDTLRADHVGCYGDSRKSTPNIDWLASNGVRFEKAYSAVPITTPSHSTIFTGTYPPYHGVRSNGEYVIPDSVKTFPQLLSKAGYQTAGFVGAFPLDRQFGFSRGFDTYDDRMPSNLALSPYSAERRAEDVMDKALQWYAKDRRAGPYFLFLHFYDPHYPYVPPEPFHSRFSGDLYSGEIAYVDTQLGRLLEVLQRDSYFENGIVILTSDHGESLGEHGEATHMVFVYDATLRVPLILAGKSLPKNATVDQPARLVDLLPTLCALGRTGLPQVVHGVDLSPAWNGKALPGDRLFYSESFLPQIQFGWAPLQSVRQGHWKYILAPQEELYDTRNDPDELKNMIGNKSTLDGQMRLLLQRAQKTLPAGKADQAARQEMDEEAAAKLESLGYFSGASAIADSSSIKNLPDPKTKIALFSRYEQALEVVATGRADEAIEQLHVILKEYPEEQWLYFRLARNLAGQKRYEELLQILTRERIKRMPLEVRTASIPLRIGALEGLDRWNETLVEWDALLVLEKQGSFEAERGKARALLHLRRFQDALKIIEPVCRVSSADQDAIHTYGLVLLGLGNEAEGLSQLARWEELEQKQKGAKTNRRNDPLLVAGRFYMAIGKTDSAVVVLRKLEQRGPKDEGAVEAGYMLSTLEPGGQGPISGVFRDSRQKAAQGNFQGAARALESLIASGARNYEIYYSLSVDYERLQQWDAALGALRKCMELNPGFAPAYADTGLIYERARADSAKAESYYRKSIQVNPGFYFGLTRLGMLLSGEGKHEEAIQVLRKAVDSAPDRPEAYNNLAMALRSAGREKEASEVLYEGQRRSTRKTADSD